MSYKYILQPYKGRHTRYACPACNKQNTFTKYIDSETGDYLHDSVGRCNREDKCAYHYTPKKYFADNNISHNSYNYHTTVGINAKGAQPIKPVSFIDFEVFKESLSGYNDNCFVEYLVGLFGSEVACGLLEKYFIGSSDHWSGATVFWQIDLEGKIRTGKVMLYNPETGKRVKKPFSHINWVHALQKESDYNLNQCLFGEHLLADSDKPVAIVESEKSAIIASAYIKDFIWLATGSLSNLSYEKCKPLEGRKVILFPDLNGFEKWSAKAEELSLKLMNTRFRISDLLERFASSSEREEGLDLADYLVRFELSKFSFPEIEIKKEESIKAVDIEESVGFCEEFHEAEDVPDKLPDKEDWGQDLEEIESFCKENSEWCGSVKLDDSTTVSNLDLFVESHLSIAKKHNGNKSYLPYFERLKTFVHKFKQVKLGKNYDVEPVFC